MTEQRQSDKPATPESARIADRYQVRERIGRGGMASVYRVLDRNTGDEVALKQLELPEETDQRLGVAAMFEREFHALAQLSHPRMIAVYEYGAPPGAAPYYTMELLDGGDLRDRAPLPWPEVCRLLFDVCSSLALLHSRRLVHRDVSPRNIRCTRRGEAKLIDFGAMSPMGPGGGQIVGTPAFTAPETVHRLALDARTDLFSLGATMYYALTKQLAFPARNFADVLSSWNVKPLPPSARVPGIPPALDDLVMSLLSLEPALRPQSAFEVMQRLAAIAGLPASESEGVSRAYLSTPTLVGREQTLQLLREHVSRALGGRGGGLMIRGAAGLGRSRVLDACALEAKTLGASVLRTTASGMQEPFSTALGLVRHLFEALPYRTIVEQVLELLGDAALAQANAAGALSVEACVRELNSVKSDPAKLQQALSRFIIAVSRTHPLVLAIDDLHRIDEPSAAVIVALVDKAQRGNLFVAMTVEDDASASGQTLEVLARRCEQTVLNALTRDQTQTLLGSMFGDVPNLGLLTDEIYNVVLGNPRQTMDLAQHLLDRRSIAYAAGTWTLPSVFSAADMPRSAEETIKARSTTLEPVAQALAEAQSLAFAPVFKREDYYALRPELDARTVDEALSELLRQQALASDGETYALSNRIWAAAFRKRLSPELAATRHLALVEVYRRQNHLRAVVHHLFSSGHDEEGLDALLSRHREFAENFNFVAVMNSTAVQLGPSYLRAIDTAKRLKRSPRELHDLLHWGTALSIVSDAEFYRQVAPPWLERLKLDTGLAAWQADTETTDAGARITRALQAAQARYLATPEHERVYRVDEAIRNLALYAAISVAVGVRIMDNELVASIPPLLEPFAGLSPVLRAVQQNTLATLDMTLGKYEAARERWLKNYATLEKMTGVELQHIEVVRNAVAFGIGTAEAALGLASAATWAARLDYDPMQRLSAMSLRRIVRLEQGDWQGADRIRRETEVQALQTCTPQMFNTQLSLELVAYARAGDLAGTKELMERIRALAAKYPGWTTYLQLAEARFEQQRGDLNAAKRGFEQCIALTGGAPGAAPTSALAWLGAQAGLAEVLLALDRVQDAHDSASAALVRCRQYELDVQAVDLSRVLALTEARLGDFSAANARIDALIERQTQLGVSGLRLGLSYEARAEIAIWSGDEDTFETFARHTAREYRHAARSPLGARYERLMNAAHRRGFQGLVDLSEFESGAMLDSSRSLLNNVSTLVLQALSGVRSDDERMRRALRLLCDARVAKGGHFFAVRDDNVTLAASFRLSDPPASLIDLVREYVSRERERSETMTVMATDLLNLEMPAGDDVVQVNGVSYDLLLLSCAVDGQGQVVGAAAVVPGETRVRSAQQAQLLSALALHLNSPHQDRDPALATRTTGRVRGRESS